MRFFRTLLVALLTAVVVTSHALPGRSASDYVVGLHPRGGEEGSAATSTSNKNNPEARWKHAIEEGEKVLARLDAAPGTIDQSKWTFDDLKKYGWRETINTEVDPASSNHIRGGLQAYEQIWKEWGLSYNPTETRIREWKQELQPEVTQPNGEKYFVSGGKYKSLLNRELIIAKNNYSPRYWVTDRKHEPDQVKNVVPLQHWSDVTFLDYADVCENDARQMQSLRGIAHEHIATGFTRDVVNTALGKKKLLPYSQRVTWTVGKDREALALLGTPPGKGVGYFLAQHREELGWKTVTSISVYANSQSETIKLDVLFNLGPHPKAQYVGHKESAANVQRRYSAIELSPRGDGDAATKAAAAPATYKASGPTADQQADKLEEDWKLVVANGEKALKLLNAQPGTVAQSKWTDYDDLKKYGWKLTTDMAIDPDFNSVINGGFGAYKQLWDEWKLSDVPTQTYSREWMQNEPAQELNRHGEKYLISGGSYQNLYNPDFILAENIYSPAAILEQDHGLKIPKDDPEHRIVPLRHWSDITFLEYAHMVGEQNKQLMQSLRGVAHGMVQRGFTHSIAHKALAEKGFTLQPYSRRAVMNVDEHPEALALLGTPHGKAVANLLAQHREQLGWKTITYVSLFANREKSDLALNILFTIEPHPNAQASTLGQRESSASVRRHDSGIELYRRSDDDAATANTREQNWKIAIQKGQQALNLLNAPLEAVEQSKWTYDDLEKYGWLNTKDHDLDNPILKAKIEGGRVVADPPAYKQIWDEWGLWEDPKLTRKITRKITRKQKGEAKVLRPDGGKYVVSKAKYKNIYNPKIIIALSNYSPETPYFGGKKPQGWEDIPKDNLVPLRRWSDVTFLDYANLYTEQQMRNLRGVARSSMTTGFTREIVDKACYDNKLNPRKLLPYNQKVTWKLGDDPDEVALAFLGTAHGKDVAYLLAQHRAQLGWKTITSISLFANNDQPDFALNMLFHIAPHPTTEQQFTAEQPTIEQPRPAHCRVIHRTRIQLQTSLKSKPKQTS